MANVMKLKKLLDILSEHGQDDQLVQADHDIIYLSTQKENAPFAEELKACGARYNSEQGWYVYV